MEWSGQCRNINGTKDLKTALTENQALAVKEEVGHIGGSTRKFEQQVLGGQYTHPRHRPGLDLEDECTSDTEGREYGGCTLSLQGKVRS